MRYRQLFFCVLLFAVSTGAQAGSYCKYGGKHKPQARTTLSDPGEENYDMKHIVFHMHVTDTSTYIIGDVATTAQVIVPSLSTYVFELDTCMHIDSAKVNGTVLPVVTTAPQVRTITLPVPLTAGALFTAEVYYHGTPVSTGMQFFNGVTRDSSSHGSKMLYTVSDPWQALNWWPTKQDVNDKIDSVDMYVTVPHGQQDGSNGVLLSVDTTTAPGYATYHWQTHYAITYYLISMAVAPYVQNAHYMHFTGSTDSMLIQNFFMDTASFYPAYKSNFDSLDLIINYYGSLFGRYPFWKEKYGVCYTTLPGGMEHQTMTTIGIPNTYIIAHELCHQWFGDHVSYNNWGDVWLSEGFATFSEQMFLTKFWGAAAGLTHRQTYLNQVFNESCGELHITDTTGPNTLFDPYTVYAKGQGVVTMLRYLAPTDSLFFQGLKNYQSAFGFGNAKTADLQATMENVYGFSLDTFFHEWVYGKGYPKYKVTWDQYGSAVTVKLVQTRSCTTYDTTFSTLLELQLHSTTADTILKVYNNTDTQVYTFNWTPTMSTMYLNPDVWTICKLTVPVARDTTLRYLSVANVGVDDVKVFPNPSKGNWQVQGVAANSHLTLTDAVGKVLWRGSSDNGITIVPGDNLTTGVYFLVIDGNKRDCIKLEHW